MSVEEIIPAFYMWKTFNDTIPVLMKADCNEASVKRLASIIQSKDCSNIFICGKDPSQTFEQYLEIADKYKAFTTWVLGQFFYLLGVDKFENLHDVMIDTQLCVLEQLSKTQLQVYHELSGEYLKALHCLVDFCKSHSGNNLILEIFIPKNFNDLTAKLDLSPVFMEIESEAKCLVILGKLMKFVKYILMEQFAFYSFDVNTFETLRNLLFLLKGNHVSNRLHIIEIFVDILKSSWQNFEEHSVDLKRCFYSFCPLFAQIVYKVYEAELVLDVKDMERFEKALFSYLVIHCEPRNNFQQSNDILNFIYKKCLYGNGILPSENIQLVALNNFIPDHDLSSMASSIKFSNRLFLCSKTQIINDILAFEAYARDIPVFNDKVSSLWCTLQTRIMENIEEMNCGVQCKMHEFFSFFRKLTNMLLNIILSITKAKGKDCRLLFFKESTLQCFLKKFLMHVDNCHATVSNIENTFNFLVDFVVLTNSININIIFHFLAYPHLKPVCYNNDNQLPNNFIGEDANGDAMFTLKSFYKFLSTQVIPKNISLRHIRDLFSMLSSGLMNIKPTQIQAIEEVYINICKGVLKSGDHGLVREISETVPHILMLFQKTDVIISDIWNVMFSSGSKQYLEAAMAQAPTVLCCMSSDFLKIIELNEATDKLEIRFCCEKCELDNIQDETQRSKKLEFVFGNDITTVRFKKIQTTLPVGTFMLKYTRDILTNGTPKLKVISLGALSRFSSHIPQFHSANVVKIWVALADSEHKEVRDEFSKTIGLIFKHSRENTDVSSSIQDEVFNLIFMCLLDLTKKSLKSSNFPLQDSLLSTIEDLIYFCPTDKATIEIMKILLYLIMVPTSKYSLIAVNKCFKLADRTDSTTTTIYSQNKKELCEVIVHLCCVNQALINYTLSTSLEKVSLMLGFYGSKDLIFQESNHLLPYFVCKIVKMPSVETLIQEMASMMDMELSEMLACKYGYIFVHIFGDMPEDEFEKCIGKLEAMIGIDGLSLRKRNFRIILNELLLSFHKKRDKVISALKRLASEDTENKTNSTPDYLRSHFLGVLLYFDVKLISKAPKKDEYLRSLADLFRYMGSKHITPLRFKIIAMLQTTNYGNFPNLSCEVWDAFIRTCEIESLGPQLALIVVYIIQLIDHCPDPINNILTYLIIENKQHVHRYIQDLFFLKNAKVDPQILALINKHLTALDKSSLKDKIQRFLKYLTHEAMEVRIQGLRQLKGYFEQSRKELDKMILDYNGIDPTIVELIDILTLGCREKDTNLKLACGEVIGELAAIEPSHLPRRYVHDESSFSFYIYDNSFITSCLNELIKAMQTEKNTQSMDRYALAIQEILKGYDISPDVHSNKFYLWNEFPVTQREVMLPLLSSRYIIAQTVLASNLPVPIYGSNSGASFQSWLYSWTCNLISSLPNERKRLLLACLPSMKQDNRILMHFLPHILLHALLEGTDGITDMTFTEIKAVTSSFTKQKTLNKKVLNLRPIPIPRLASDPQIITPEEVKQMQCTKVVFLLLDFLDRWVREWEWQNASSRSHNHHFQIVKVFQNRFCKLQVAKCNYHCGEYPRALMYLEDYITDNKSEIDNHLSFLAEIYAQLDEPDGVDGVTALQQNEPSVNQRILALEVSGKLADATTCYERMLQPEKLQHIQGLVQCYLDLDNVNTALNVMRGASENQPEFGNMLLEVQAEPLWRLGQYDELEHLLQKPELARNTSWGVSIGRTLLYFKNGKRDEFEKLIDGLSKQQVESLGAASLEEGAYQHGYGSIVKLHALNELKQLEKIMNELVVNSNDFKFAENLMTKLKDEWELRIKVVQESVRIIEPLLCLRRVSLNLAKNIAQQKAPSAVPHLDALIGECYLFSSRVARAAGMHQQAYTYTIKAEDSAPLTLFLEKAKLHWLREEHDQALITLRRGLEVMLPNGSATSYLGVRERKICAEAALLIATYNDEISNVETDINLSDFRTAIGIYKEWEKSYVCLAQYYDKIYQNYSDEDRDTKGSQMQVEMITHFGRSLHYGTNYIYQSLPRLLSIWFDYGTRLLDVTDNTIKEERRNVLCSMTKLVDWCLKKLPTYMFLTAFSQLVSRICHPQHEVYVLTKCIIVKLLQEYPQQSLWMIISVIKSSYSVRSKRCAEILCDMHLRTSSLLKLIKDFTSLAEKLIELCNKEIASDVSKTSVNSLLRTLPRLLGKEDFSEIMMPTYKFRKLILPNPDFSSGKHNPFPNQYVHIVGIEDEINVLPSLQRPRKITLRGSDGKGYIFMLKPKDDLRKDFRLMEFNDIVNQLLSREGEARQRRLNIRLYSVAPLNEECGVIEWVPNLVGLRPVLTQIYKQKGIATKLSEVKNLCCNIRDPLNRKRDIFTKKLLPKHPPVLSEWFRKTFPDAQSWLTARTAYIRTTAVMSMVGYILGLGDRHGENILLDSMCGDVVHVDFNCLFNKGEKFDWPERVPFRLTHNMEAAMGPLGVEGLFRKSCACTLRVLRMNSNTLMSIVTPFVYDPLVSWPRNVSALASVHNAERTNEEAVDYVKNIKLRLEGKIKPIKEKHCTPIMPLSVDGHTNYLIKEAVSVDNLCQMYVGWGAYL